jgi:hypothetical protein
MDWLKELLKKMGVADTEVDKIDGEIAKELPKHFVTKTQYNEVAEARKKAEKDVAERDTQISELGKVAGLSEELKAQITKLTADNQEAAEKHASELKDIKITNGIKSLIAGKAHDEELVAGLFDRDKLVVDGDKIVGIDEQFKSMQETKEFLFKSEQQNPPGFHVGAGGAGTGQATNDQLATIFGVADTK